MASMTPASASVDGHPQMARDEQLPAAPTPVPAPKPAAKAKGRAKAKGMARAVAKGKAKAKPQPAAKAKAKAKPQAKAKARAMAQGLQNCFGRPMSAPLGLPYRTANYRIMWYRRSRSIAVRQCSFAKRQLGSAVCLCSKEAAYERAMVALHLLEDGILLEHGVAAALRSRCGHP